MFRFQTQITGTKQHPKLSLPPSIDFYPGAYVRGWRTSNNHFGPIGGSQPIGFTSPGLGTFSTSTNGAGGSPRTVSFDGGSFPGLLGTVRGSGDGTEGVIRREPGRGGRGGRGLLRSTGVPLEEGSLFSMMRDFRGGISSPSGRGLNIQMSNNGEVYIALYKACRIGHA